ncbi:UDP-glucuronosyltransferase 1A5-like [Lycorma delicatula]|uniref:UDP-glucuronosyltransferase 1A5-like n=1 Tax=Lycorma delicatula TaxID=130591 RepID=UPI003F51834F
MTYTKTKASVLAIPLFADQDFNSIKLQQSGAGIALEFNDITLAVLEHAINEILTNDSYRINMKKFNKINKDKSKQAVEEAIVWIKYVLRHSGLAQLCSECENLKCYNSLLRE